MAHGAWLSAIEPGRIYSAGRTPGKAIEMKYNDNANLDTSEVEDTRGSSGGGGSSIGGGLIGVLLGGLLSGRRGKVGGGLGVVAVVIYLVLQFAGGSSSKVSNILGSLGQTGQPATADNAQIAKECKTGSDANTHLECAVVADINSIQDYWGAELPRLGQTYTEVPTVWFSGQVSTGCGAADSGAGPFYCPADKKVFIDLSFYNDIETQFKATGGEFVDAYVLAHEYGHHVQDLLGVEAKVRSRQGATSDSVRLELQADCYAGVWAKHATEPGPNGEPALVQSIDSQDFTNALEIAGHIGDDWIQENLGNGEVNQNAFTHGSSAQREKWLTTGYTTGDPKACDTFSAKGLG